MIERLLITGAAGGIAGRIHGKLGHVARQIRYSDLTRPDWLEDDAEFVTCDLADADAVMGLVEGCDGVLNLGGISVERSFEEILPANIIAIHSLYEAARLNGCPRIFLASSNHVIGYYKQDEVLDAGTPHRPDGWYGISKSYSEAVALMYHDKFGQQSAMVRIGSCFEEPRDHRMLKTWISVADFVALVDRVFNAPHLGCPVIYGVSANEGSWWDNSGAAHLGWVPKDNGADFAKKMRAKMPVPPQDDPSMVYQGGAFTAIPILKPDK